MSVRAIGVEFVNQTCNPNGGRETDLMDRDAVVDLVDHAGLVGVALLMLLHVLGGATIGELALMRCGHRQTLGTKLRELEARRLALRVGLGHAEKWHISGEGCALLGLPQLSKNSTVADVGSAAAAALPSGKIAAVVVGPTVENFDSSLQKVGTALGKALLSAGIGRNAHAELARLEWMTPAYIKAHAKYARDRGDSTGLLITRLRSGDPVPRSKRPKRGDERNLGREWQEYIERNSPGYQERTRAKFGIVDEDADG